MIEGAFSLDYKLNILLCVYDMKALQFDNTLLGNHFNHRVNLRISGSITIKF